MSNTVQDDSTFVLVVTRMIQAALQDVQRYKQLLRCRGTDAQKLLDVFQWLLDSSELDANFRRNLIVATQRISEKSGLYPVCYELKDVVQDGQHPVTAGGFADIYKGDFQGGSVCIKAIRVYQDSEVEHLLKQFAKEAILWGQLRHRNVAPIYGLYRFRNQLCLVSPWMEHGDIARYLKKNPKAPRRQLADDVAQGLKYLHENGIIHGDLKGPNILIDDTGRACVTDFGISSISDPDILAWTSHSSAASKGGSVRWQAPELFDVENDEVVQNSVASDVYAWACVCYEIFTDSLPFANIPRDLAIILKIKLGNRPARPAEGSSAWQHWGLTENIWALMVDCWKENPAERPSIEEAIDRLRPEISAGEWLSARKSAYISPARFRRRVAEPLDAMTVSTLSVLLDSAIDADAMTHDEHSVHGLDELHSPSCLLPSPVSHAEDNIDDGSSMGHEGVSQPQMDHPIPSSGNGHFTRPLVRSSSAPNLRIAGLRRKLNKPDIQDLLPPSAESERLVDGSSIIWISNGCFRTLPRGPIYNS